MFGSTIWGQCGGAVFLYTACNRVSMAKFYISWQSWHLQRVLEFLHHSTYAACVDLTNSTHKWTWHAVNWTLVECVELTLNPAFRYITWARSSHFCRSQFTRYSQSGLATRVRELPVRSFAQITRAHIYLLYIQIADLKLINYPLLFAPILNFVYILITWIERTKNRTQNSTNSKESIKTGFLKTSYNYKDTYRSIVVSAWVCQIRLYERLTTMY